MFSLQDAIRYLKKERNITVSRQRLYELAKEHTDQCQKIGGNENTRPGMWLIPQQLLDTYVQSERHKKSGDVHKVTSKPPPRKH